MSGSHCCSWCLQGNESVDDEFKLVAELTSSWEATERLNIAAERRMKLSWCCCCCCCMEEAKVCCRERQRRMGYRLVVALKCCNEEEQVLVTASKDALFMLLLLGMAEFRSYNLQSVDDFAEQLQLEAPGNGLRV
ncbi:hypothetical protein C5167_043582 [Papaver somniferum]|uniref:Uncharacterized protein n=1 Tax=Papaver somniferum TaxID=3469 RepID=A0A4Y7L9M8_PAPSO|nr:hypothetical protein C5167_043582 [Papaver somniferum]